jgi:hypothetical protein
LNTPQRFFDRFPVKFIHGASTRTLIAVNTVGTRLVRRRILAYERIRNREGRDGFLIKIA